MVRDRVKFFVFLMRLDMWLANVLDALELKFLNDSEYELVSDQRMEIYDEWVKRQEVKHGR